MASVVTFKMSKGKSESESRDFQCLEIEFNCVLHDISSDRQLGHFHREYEKLLCALTSSHENEKKLMKKCQEMNSNILESTVKVQQALRLSQEENDHIRAFQTDLERAVNTLEAFKEKEDKAKNTIQRLHQEIGHLGVVMEQGSGLAVGQDSTMRELSRAKNELTKEVAIASEHIAAGQQQRKEAQERISLLLNEQQRTHADIEESTSSIIELQRRTDQEISNRQETEKQVDAEKEECGELLTQILLKQEEITQLNTKQQMVCKELALQQDLQEEKKLATNQAERAKRRAEENKLSQETANEQLLQKLEQTEDSFEQ